MTHHELTRTELTRTPHAGKRSRRLTALASIAALALGALALAGCDNGEEDLPPMEEPAGEASSTMDQEPATNGQAAQDPAADQQATMDQQEPEEPARDQGTSSDEAASAMEQEAEGQQEGQNQQDDDEASGS